MRHWQYDGACLDNPKALILVDNPLDIRWSSERVLNGGCGLNKLVEEDVRQRPCSMSWYIALFEMKAISWLNTGDKFVRQTISPDGRKFVPLVRNWITRKCDTRNNRVHKRLNYHGH